MISVISVESIVPEKKRLRSTGLSITLWPTRAVLIIKSESPSQFFLWTPRLGHCSGQHELLIRQGKFWKYKGKEKEGKSLIQTNLPWSQCFRCCLCQKLQRFAQQKVLPSLPVRQPRTWQTSWINSPDIVLYCRRVLFLVFAFLLHFINRINSRHYTCLYLSLCFINNFNQHQT